ncbi:hypothetical protein DL98DRAFT_648174 [Cadophora sp. DSE1049]|nr:hypothetical protein DL98DRAFT_648174 [Cadophora sp. DSE1049]
MSGFEIVGVILGIYPLIVTAAALYKDTKTTRDAASSLTRRLEVEKVIYGQFVRKLLASDVPAEVVEKMVFTNSTSRQSWNDATLGSNLSRRLGPHNGPIILQILKELHKTLGDLNEELKQPDRGLEALGGLRWQSRVKRCFRSQLSVQERLRQLRKLNKDLTRLLDVSQPTTTFKPQNNPSIPTNFLVRDCHQAKDLYELMGQSYICNCNEPHVANFGLHRPSKNLHCFTSSKTYKWRFDVLFPLAEPKQPQSLGTLQQSSGDEAILADEKVAATDVSDEEDADTGSRSVVRPIEPPSWKHRTSVTLLVDNDRQHNDDQSIIHDLCSFMRTLISCPKRPEVILGFIGNNNKTYKMYPNQEAMATSASIVRLDELWAPGHRRLQRKERLQLAFRLSSTILQFSRTPWIDQSWTWKDISALQREEPQIALSQLFVSRKFYSVRLPASSNVERHSPLGPYDDQPILTKLGFALIEIVLGRSLSAIGKEQPGEENVDLDLDLLNLRTAQALLRSGRIASEESQGYEDVVKACIRHQYRGRQDLQIKGLDSTDVSFFDNVEEAILGPLYMECIKSWGAERLDG